MTYVPTTGDQYYLFDGHVFRPTERIEHREYEYDSAGFEILRQMQEKHFWYRGRHRFLLWAVQDSLSSHRVGAVPCRAVDLGGGCGGWLRYLGERLPAAFSELALADSSMTALASAQHVVPQGARMYQCDLMRLGWTERWDVVFLLDVLEHLPDETTVLKGIREAIVPGGLLFITTPALSCFWTWNDQAAHHQRRYSKADYLRLTADCGFQLLDARYFMFFLSPLMMAIRWAAYLRHGGRQPTATEVKALLEHTHRIPFGPVNAILSAICAAETPLGHYVPFPWGTSILAILKRD